MALDHEARVFDLQLVQHFENSLLVATAFWLDREAIHRLRKFQRQQMDVVLIVRIVQHRIEGNMLDLGHRAEVARDQLPNLLVFLALQHVEVSRLERLAGLAHV